MVQEKGRRGYGIVALILLIVSLILAGAFRSPVTASSQGSGRIIRVGWYETPFNRTDESGRRSGYAYEYQQKISAYTGWTYEYVEGSWPELLEMLKDGRIDLLSDVSYTKERAQFILYSSLPMGAEEYYIYTAPDNKEITKEDYTSFNGKKVGVNKGSIQADIFRQWAKDNNVQAELVELTGSEEENVRKLNRGDIDMYVMQDAFASIDSTVPVCAIGSSEFYFAVNKSNLDILSELNAAMTRIRDENQYYGSQLYSKYINTSGANLFLSADEQAWLSDHGTIRVGYQDNYLAFCAKDPKTGELTGALKDYLNMASDGLENAHINFETVAYPTAADALEAVKKGEVDCAFPANLTDYDGEVQGFYMTPPLMRTDMSAVVRGADKESFFSKERITVAVNAGNTNYELFLQEHFPDWRPIYFKDTPEALKAIAEGKVDCLLISNFRYNNIEELCRKYKLVTLSTGVEMDYCFAVDRDNTTLYSILAKVISAVPSASVNSALSYYFTEDAKNDLGDLVRQNKIIVIGIFVMAVLVLLFHMISNIRLKKEVAASRNLVAVTEKDRLTGLYNKDYFIEYAGQIYQEHPDRPMDAIALSIRNFHSINTISGAEYGDYVLGELGETIRAILQEREGIAGHGRPGHFAMYCSHFDNYDALYDRLQGTLDRLSSHTSIRLCMGVMPWEKDMEPARMIEQALLACRLAEAGPREHMILFDDKVRGREAFEQRLVKDLRPALDHGELEVYYQPRYDIQSNECPTGDTQTRPPKLMDAEAMLFWHHPELGMIHPKDLIPLLERNGRLVVIDKFVWEEAARQIASWRDQYGITIPVTVNLSRIDLFDPLLETRFDQLREANGLGPGDLKLKIRESTCTEDAYHVIHVLERLRKNDYEIVMDDMDSDDESHPLTVSEFESEIIRTI